MWYYSGTISERWITQKSYFASGGSSHLRTPFNVKDAIAVMKRLGMDVREGSKHLVASHPALVGSDLFPNGTITVSSHAFGNQGKAHPKAVKDILKAAKIIQEKDEDD